MNVIRIAMHLAGRVVEFSQLALSEASRWPPSPGASASPRIWSSIGSASFNAAPELLDAYRADDIDLETLKAFARRSHHGGL